MYRKPTIPLMRAAVLLAALALASGGAFAAKTPKSDETGGDDAAALARENYNRAVQYRERAGELEQKAAEAGSEKESEKLLEKAAKEYGKATRALRDAVADDPTLHQAWTTLGYTLRKTGEFGESLAAYDRALEIEPDFPEAVEYRAEAYLGLNRLEEAQEAYMELLRADRERADELLAAMRSWVEERRAAPGDLAPETVEEFAGWVAERSELAEQASLGPNGSSRGW